MEEDKEEMSTIPESKTVIEKPELDKHIDVLDNLTAHKNTITLMQGIIWAEVLGRPLSKRKHRGRNGL